eukprot:SAG22_NODE_493_length_9820_cov_53.085588_1_plen_206_part_00
MVRAVSFGELPSTFADGGGLASPPPGAAHTRRQRRGVASKPKPRRQQPPQGEDLEQKWSPLTAAGPGGGGSDDPAEAAVPDVAYRLTVVTSDTRGAGTDAAVFVDLLGERSETGRYWLHAGGDVRSAERIGKRKDRCDPFERGASDRFKLEWPELGELRGLRVGHSGAGRGSGWHLAAVLVRSEAKRLLISRLGGRLHTPCTMHH